MSSIRYRVEQVPPGQVAAFTPQTVPTPLASTHGMIHVYGSPGTTRMPSPSPAAVPAYGPDRRTKPSNVAPNWWLPEIYLSPITNLRPADGRISWMPASTMIPPTQGEISYVPTVAMRRPHIGGRAVMEWPRTVSTWPRLGSPAHQQAKKQTDKAVARQNKWIRRRGKAQQ